jgi:hypothetical protein
MAKKLFSESDNWDESGIADYCFSTKKVVGNLEVVRKYKFNNFNLFRNQKSQIKVKPGKTKRENSMTPKKQMKLIQLVENS